MKMCRVAGYKSHIKHATDFWRHHLFHSKSERLLEAGLFKMVSDTITEWRPQCGLYTGVF